MKRFTEIKDLIIKEYNTDPKLKKIQDIRDRYRGMYNTLDNRFNTLLIARLGRDAADFKPGGTQGSPLMIPDRDVPIVHAILRSSVNPKPTDQDKLIQKWLKPTGISKTDYEQIHDLHSAIETILLDLEYDNKIDDVTHEEWMRAIDISIGFDRAIAIQKNIVQMDCLMRWAAVLDLPGNGQIIENDADGSRHFIYNSHQYLYNVEERPISQIAEKCGSTEDFSILFQTILNSILVIIRSKAISTLKTVAALKRRSDAEHIEDGFHTTEQIASEYYTYYRNIYLLLKDCPDICSKIEKDEGITNLLDFLKIPPEI